MLDTGLKLYTVPSGPSSVTVRSRSRTLNFKLKVLVKVFRSLYLLKL